MNDLSTQSPSQVDVKLGELYHSRSAIRQAIGSAVNALHYLLGERLVRTQSGVRQWPSDDELAEVAVRENADNGSARAATTLTELDDYRTKLVELNESVKPLENEFDARGGWSRFFLVKDGHIHASTSCSTCYPTTRFGWLPELSGSSEKDAVEAHGPLLCSVCFPSAPVEWTVGRPKPERCEGAGKYHEPGTRRHHGMRNYGTCTGCGENQLLNPTTFVVRAHKPKK